MPDKFNVVYGALYVIQHSSSPRIDTETRYLFLKSGLNSIDNGMISDILSKKHN